MARISSQVGELRKAGTRGSGFIMILGLTATPHLLSALYNNLIKPALTVYSLTPSSAAALFQGSEDKAIELRLHLDGQIYQAQDLIRGTAFEVNTRSDHVFVSLPRKDGTILRLTPQNK